MTNQELLYHLISFIPSGQVLTYGEIGKTLNLNPRVVGSILHKNKDPENFPCHRVVNNEGRLAENYAFGGIKKQKKKLKEEGVFFNEDKVDLNKSLWKINPLLKIYFALLAKYGEPGLWPWFANGEPHLPEEIAIGAILTQNTNWRNVEKALINLRKEKANTIEGIYKLGRNDFEKLKELIKPSGFFNQKSVRLFEFCKFLMENHQSLGNFFNKPKEEAREILLGLKGIGKETADAILLYSGHKEAFVVDKYSSRFAEKLKLNTANDYDSLQNFFVKNLPKNVKLYQNFHALIVRWAQDNK